MDGQQFAEAISGKIEQRDVSVREVNGGFLLTASRRFLNPDTKSVVLQQSFEAVASDGMSAAEKVNVFLASGALA